MVNVCGALVSTPPLAVPPLSCRVTLSCAVPSAPAVVYVSVPSGETAGAAPKSSAPDTTWTANVSVWPASSDGPGEIAVAQPGTETGPELASTD